MGGGGEKMGEACTVESWDKGQQMIYEGKRPTGIVMICADNGTRNKFVYSTLERVFGTMICITSGACSADRLQEALKDSEVICVSLTPEGSCSHAKRHNIVTMLRSAGIKEVYGVYLKVADSAFEETRGAIKALKAEPPTVDGLDGLIILKS